MVHQGLVKNVAKLGLDTWEAYRDVPRLGRKKRLPEKQRAMLWSVFEIVCSKLKNLNAITYSNLFNLLASRFSTQKRKPFDFIVIDEAQDISITQLKFLAALGNERTNGLFFTGDLGQRVFQQPFSWKMVGIDIRGRSSTLYINYRTSHQIRRQADKLLGAEIADVDGNIEGRKGTVSVFNGPEPSIVLLNNCDEESRTVSLWITKLIKEGIFPFEIGIFVRSQSELERAINAVNMADQPYSVLDEKTEIGVNGISVITMHLAKGLEFRAVAVMACDDQIIPLQQRIEDVADETELEEVYNTERNLLYVACTRARDHLLITSGGCPSEFLEDMLMK